MKRKTLLDKDIRPSDYMTFSKCEVLKDGRAIRFVYACGPRYDVPVSYLPEWFYESHRIREDNRWVEQSHKKHGHLLRKMRDRTVRVVRWRQKPRFDDEAVNVFMNNCMAYTVAWDVVLMSCEQAYAHFGGFTPESRKMTAAFHKAHKKGCS